MNKQVPRAADGLICPYHQKDTAEVCHRCPKWVQIRGRDPQSEEEIDRWSCADALVPLLLIENAQQLRHVAGSTESFRNEMADAQRLSQAMFQAAVTAPPAVHMGDLPEQAQPGLLGRVFRLVNKG
ncbi:MAG: hypothetical protein JNK17_02150 [Hydrogenophaga sp.]|nr:hypothetical protein [Hydrogenophaga sp.]